MTQATPTATPTLAGRYRIEEKLGTGRLAVVYRAHDDRLQRAVLVHMLRKDLLGQEPLRQRFTQEAHASARRSHQSLLEVFDSGDLAGRPYMITEYVAGRTIRDMGALSVEEALLYFRQLVGAIAVCQDAGVPHPPISSRNLILVADGHVELVESWLTPTNEVGVDLACYRAPERTEGLPTTHASAVYALGLLLLEMLSGRRVVSGSDARAVAQAHLTANIPALAEIWPAVHIPLLEQIIRTATARRPEDRYPDAAALGQASDDLWREMNSETQRLVLPAAVRPRLRQRPPQPVPVQTAISEPQTEQQAAVGNLIAPLAPVHAQSRRRSLTGLGIMLALFLVVAVAAYTLASITLERLAGISIPLPRPQVSLPEIPSGLPEWLTGVVSGGDRVYVVSGVSAEGLNLRSKPGTTSEVIALLPNQTLVRQLRGPENADGVVWLYVRTRLGDKELEGWVSQNFVQPLKNPDKT